MLLGCSETLNVERFSLHFAWIFSIKFWSQDITNVPLIYFLISFYIP